jgi:hypothetical protein
MRLNFMAFGGVPIFLADLAGLREAKRLADLPEPERAECLALWDRVAVSLK